MSKSQFIQYLYKIEAQKAINIKNFIVLADLMGLPESQLLKIVNWKKLRADRYQVDIIDPLAFKQMKQQLSLATLITPATNRVEASISGNSHRCRVSGSLISVLAFQQHLPSLIVVDNKGNYQSPIALHKHLLVIENLENFLALINNPKLLAKWLDKHWDCDIVFADGNRISNKLHRKFFSQYDKIRCLLDLDLGGLKIFSNIDSLVTDSLEKHGSCEFILSDYFLKKYQQHGRRMDQASYQLIQALNYPEKIVFVVKMLLKNKKIAEQEILLWN